MYHCANRILQGLLSLALHKLRYTSLKIPYWIHSGLGFDKCYKKCSICAVWFWIYTVRKKSWSWIEQPMYKSFENNSFCYTSLLKNTMGKGELTSNFSFFPLCFLSLCGTFCHFHQIRNCLLQTLSVWKSLKCVVWERHKRVDNNVWKFTIAGGLFCLIFFSFPIRMFWVIFKSHFPIFDWMVLYAAFNSISVSHITATAHIVHVFSWVLPVLGWALKCLAQGHSHEKTQGIQCGSNPGPLDYESNTLPLSHATQFLFLRLQKGLVWV